MATVKVATSAEQPINRVAQMSGYAGSEGDLVGIDPTTGDMVLADAAVGTAIPAVGVALNFVRNPADWASYPEPVQAVADEQYSRLGVHKIAAADHGIIVENVDEDWNFTPGGVVYLAEGGGYTQTPPSTTGDLIQVVGVGVDDGEAVYVRVNFDHEVSA
jgi:hypothetical protein